MEEKKQTVLTLKFIGIDDFSCPTYEDQYGRFWKDLNLGKSETPDLYSTTRNDLDGEPVSHIQQASASAVLGSTLAAISCSVKKQWRS